MKSWSLLVRELVIEDLPLDLVEAALTHSSYLNDYPQATDNERLEFLGDAVLSVFCSQALFTLFPFHREGDLSRLRAHLVCEDTLAELARQYRFAQCLRLGRSARGSRAVPASILAGAVEAVLGAVYLSLGHERAGELFALLYEELLSPDLLTSSAVDAKTALQELFPEGIRYELASQTGPDHDPVFEVHVLAHGRLVASGSGSSKKRAEQEAARKALVQLNEV